MVATRVLHIRTNFSWVSWKNYLYASDDLITALIVKCQEKNITDVYERRLVQKFQATGYMQNIKESSSEFWMKELEL